MNEEDLTHWALSRQKKMKKVAYQIICIIFDIFSSVVYNIMIFIIIVFGVPYFPD
jgi:hypothetical protein